MVAEFDAAVMGSKVEHEGVGNKILSTRETLEYKL